MSSLQFDIRPEEASDQQTVERLHERAFGPGRFTRAAYLLREHSGHDRLLSFTAVVGTFVVGSIRQTPVCIGTSTALFLGPLTVDPSFAGKGIGSALMKKALEKADETGHILIFLVGDAPYYARFGFKVVPPHRFSLPAPADPARFMYRETQAGTLDHLQGRIWSSR